jgi:hypothetical protein
MAKRHVEERIRGSIQWAHGDDYQIVRNGRRKPIKLGDLPAHLQTYEGFKIEITIYSEDDSVPESP